MKLYLVRWPTLRAALVAAKDEDDLVINKLDQLADPSYCKWEEYRGSFYLDIDTGYAADRDGVVSGELSPRLKVSLGEVDENYALATALSAFAFPNMYKTEKEWPTTEDGYPKDPDEFKKAMRAAAQRDYDDGVKHEEMIDAKAEAREAAESGTEH